MTSLFSILLLGCQDTQIVTRYQYKEIIKYPPSAALVECNLPFTEPPATYGAAALRDEVWLEAFRQCACKIEKNRQFYGHANQSSQCEALTQLSKDE